MSAAKPAEKKAKVPASHPPYSEMIITAFHELKTKGGKKGVSKQALDKYIREHYKIENTKPHLKITLKKMVDDSRLIQVKGLGASGSFKLGEKPKVVKPKKVAKPKPKTVVKSTKKKSTPAKGKKVKGGAKKAASAAAKKATKSPGKKASAKKSPKKSSKTAAKKPAAKKAAAKKPAAKKPAKKAAKAK